jgi:hypothetical protein
LFAAFNLGGNPFFAKHPITSLAGDIMRIRRSAQRSILCVALFASARYMKRKAESHGLVVSAGMPYAALQSGLVVADPAGKKQPWEEMS